MTAPTLTPDDIVELLRKACREHKGGQAGWARAHGYTRSYVNMVLQGVAQPSENLAKKMGFKRVVSFVRSS